MANKKRTAEDKKTSLNIGLEASQFIEKMGLSSQNDGLPKIAGRMAGYFILYGGPTSFAELAELLQVSRGSISTNARLLVALGFIERVSIPGQRQDYFKLSRSPYARLMEGSLHRLRHVSGIIEEVKQTPLYSEKETAERLDEMDNFYDQALKTTEILVRNLEKESRKP